MDNSINGNSGVDSLRWGEASQTPDAEANKQLDQEDFFALLTKQLAYQDPSNPVDNDKMVDQMTSFSMAEGITDLNSSFKDFAASMTSNMALQASSLVGQEVRMSGNVVTVPEEFDDKGLPVASPQAGVAALPANAENVKVTIMNANGQVMKVMQLGDQKKGDVSFEWDGNMQTGTPAPAGNYIMKVQGKVGDEYPEFAISRYAKVDSVSLTSSSGQVMLNLQGGNQVSMSQVEAIGRGSDS